MPAATDAIRPEELDTLFACMGDVRPDAGVALAVSGGGDSTALTVLFADWLRRHGREAAPHAVLTVDHRLRAESAAEADAVSGLAARLGFRHATLVWEEPKPQSGLQAAAREARYRLMGGYVRAHGLAALLTAHTLDDQAETLIMRLARGSGLDGLACMGRETRMRGVRLLRPLLDVAKPRLLATLRERGVSWIEDPSNQSPAFERTRLRAARATLDALGLTAEMLGTSVRRLQRARRALDSVTASYCAEPPAGVVHTDPAGLFAIDRERLSGAPEEIAVRILDRCITAAGGSHEPVALSRLEPIVAGLRGGGETGSWTLARAHISATVPCIRIEREPGRRPLPVLALAPGATALWDGRFQAGIAAGFEGSLEVRALGAEGVAELRQLGWDGKPARPLKLAAAFWQGARLVAAPPAGYWSEPRLEGLLSANFVGLRYELEAPGSGERSAIDKPC
jgi:tRNA(Ile)-lysidine synthase